MATISRSECFHHQMNLIMKKSLFSAAFIGLSTPVINGSAYADNFSWLAGKDQSEAFQDPRFKPIARKVEKDIGANNYKLASRWLSGGVSGPVSSSNGVYYVSGCQQGLCSDHIVIAVADDGKISVLFNSQLAKPEVKNGIYGNPSNEVRQHLINGK